jgi:hypothetical protein
MSARIFFRGVKWPGRDVDYPHPSITEVKERVELFLYPPLRDFMACSGAKFIIFRYTRHMLEY